MVEQLALPVVIGDYTFMRTLGYGATAVVYLVEHKVYHTQYAAKGIRISGSQEIQLEDAFKSEMDAISILDHTGVIRPYDLLKEDGVLYIILEYCSGGTILSNIELGYGLKNIPLIPTIKQIVSALAYCHRMNYAHRDIKPNNILVDNYMRAKIADFGFARVIKQGDVLDSFEGSFVYSAPELIMRTEYDPFKADVWSLGVTMYHMATGMLPWAANTMEEARRAIISGQIRVPTAMNPMLWRLIQKMLNLSPQNRPTMDEIERNIVFRYSPSPHKNRNLGSFKGKNPILGNRKMMPLRNISSCQTIGSLSPIMMASRSISRKSEY